MKKTKRTTRTRLVRRKKPAERTGLVWTLVVLVVAGAIGWYAYKNDTAGAGAFPTDTGGPTIAYQILGDGNRTPSSVNTANTLDEAYRQAKLLKASSFLLVIQDGSTLTTEEVRYDYDFTKTSVRNLQIVGLTAAEMAKFIKDNALPKDANIRGSRAKLSTDGPRFSNLRITMPTNSITNVNRINFADLNLDIEANYGSQVYIERNSFSRQSPNNYADEATVSRLSLASIGYKTGASNNNYYVVRDNWIELAKGYGTNQYRIGARIDLTTKDALAVTENQFYVPSKADYPSATKYNYRSIWVTGNQKEIQGMNIMMNKFWADVKTQKPDLRITGVQVNSLKTPENSLVIQGNIFANKRSYYASAQDATVKNTIVIGDSWMGKLANVYYDPSRSNTIKDKF